MTMKELKKIYKAEVKRIVSHGPEWQMTPEQEKWYADQSEAICGDREEVFR